MESDFLIYLFHVYIQRYLQNVSSWEAIMQNTVRDRWKSSIYCSSFPFSEPQCYCVCLTRGKVFENHSHSGKICPSSNKMLVNNGLSVRLFSKCFLPMERGTTDGKLHGAYAYIFWPRRHLPKKSSVNNEYKRGRIFDFRILYKQLASERRRGQEQFVFLISEYSTSDCDKS